MTTNDKLIILNIERVRARNNKHWMDLVRLAFEGNKPVAKDLMRKILECDKEINKLTSELVED